MIKQSFLKKIFSIFVLLAVIILGVIPLINSQSINSEIISTSIIIICVGLGYLSILYRPQWNKAVLFFEGLIIVLTGTLFLTNPYNYFFIVIGIVVILISILAYMKKMPSFFLDFFYRN
ncbi:hypothetical protein [Methanobrevibacter sp. DSM 116169]|uniref:hypothetical protein n=1 Tax=Methanobrevibacter sp. DSM 116169 TaxID=3242727 RepID=UPI0038FC9D37